MDGTMASDRQLVINTGTLVSTSLVVFLIRTHRIARPESCMKLDELIRAIQPARTSLVQMEELTDEELEFFKRNSRPSATMPTPNLV
jgi:low affinity Fe/Cu permease